MTYKLNPTIGKIASPIVLMIPDGTRMEFESGTKVCSVVFENRYVVKEMRAKNNVVIINLMVAKEPPNDVTFFE